MNTFNRSTKTRVIFAVCALCVTLSTAGVISGLALSQHAAPKQTKTTIQTQQQAAKVQPQPSDLNPF